MGEAFEQEYDPFGAFVGGPAASGDITRHGFTGHEQDDDLGLTDMGGRIYDPLGGRFMTPDPIMQAPFWSQGLNRWSYVFNDPVNLTDPSGFATGDPGMDQSTYQAIGAAATLVHSFPVSGSIYVLVQSAGASLALPAVSLAGQLALTGLIGPGAAREGGTATVAAPTSAPTTNPGAPKGMNAKSQLSALAPLVQERRYEGPQYAQETTKQPWDPSPCPPETCSRTVYIPLPDGTAFVQMGQAVAFGARNLWRWLTSPGASKSVLGAISRGKSMQQAVQQLNQAGATQAQAVQVLKQVVQNAGKDLLPGTLQGSAPGTVVLSGVQAGPGAVTPVIVIAENGVATFGTATVSSIGRTAIELANFVPKVIP